MIKLNRWEWGALALAIGVRIGAHASLLATRHAQTVLVDAHTYWTQAAALAAGKNPFADGFYQPPGYPMILGQIRAVFGDALMAPRVLQQLCGLLTMVLLMRLGRSMAQRPWAGALAGLLFALYGPVLMFELDLLTPAIVSLVVVATVTLIRVATPLSMGVAVALSAIAAAVHPSMLLLALGVVAVAGVRGAGVKAALIGLCLGLLPMTSANVERYGQWQVGSNNAGINFYIGNNPDWKTTTFTRAGLRFRKLALEAEPHKRDSFARNDYWRSRALSGIAAAPHEWLGAMATRLHWSVNNVEIPRNEDHRCRTEAGAMAWMGWSPVRFGWVFPLALIGLLGMPRGHERRSWGLVWLALHAPLVLFIVSDRYRLASWPVVCLLAPLGAVQLRLWWASSEWRRMAPWGALALIPFAPLDGRTDVDPAWCDHTAGNLAVAAGDLEAAESLYLRAIAADPGDWSARRWLAASMMKKREYPAALEQVEWVLAEFPDSFPMLKMEASLHERMGNYRAAAESMERAYRVPGERTSTGMQVLRLWRKAGDEQRVERLLRDDPALSRRWAQKRRP